MVSANPPSPKSSTSDRHQGRGRVPSRQIRQVATSKPPQPYQSAGDRRLRIGNARGGAGARLQAGARCQVTGVPGRLTAVMPKIPKTGHPHHTGPTLIARCLATGSPPDPPPEGWSNPTSDHQRPIKKAKNPQEPIHSRPECPLTHVSLPTRKTGIKRKKDIRTQPPSPTSSTCAGVKIPRQHHVTVSNNKITESDPRTTHSPSPAEPITNMGISTLGRVVSGSPPPTC